ncbi:MAG: hypothetical protein ACRDTE_05390 [Pseudonocardiaceae bacterium]
MSHDFPAGRAGARRREELAATLEGLAVIVRASAPEGPAGPSCASQGDRRG